METYCWLLRSYLVCFNGLKKFKWITIGIKKVPIVKYTWGVNMIPTERNITNEITISQ